MMYAAGVTTPGPIIRPALVVSHETAFISGYNARRQLGQMIVKQSARFSLGINSQNALRNVIRWTPEDSGIIFVVAGSVSVCGCEQLLL